MSARDLGSLAFKLVGIYVIVQALRLLPSLMTLPGYAQYEDMVEMGINMATVVLGHLIPILLLGSLGIYLVSRSRVLAGYTIHDDSDRPSGLRAFDVHAILFSALGVLLLGFAAAEIPALVWTFALYVSEYGTVGGEERQLEVLRENWVWAAGLTLQIAIGIVLLIWANRIAVFFHPGEAPVPRPEAVDSACPRCGHPFSYSDYRPDVDKRLCSKCNEPLPEPG